MGPVRIFTCTQEPVSQFLQRLMLFSAGRSKRGDANGSKKRQNAGKHELFPPISLCI